MTSSDGDGTRFPCDGSRRRFLKFSGTVAAGLPLLRTHFVAAQTPRPVSAAAAPASQRDLLWYTQPAAADRLLFEGLPVGNGHLGALIGGEPDNALLHLTLASQWTGGRNSRLLADGQFPYATDNFGSFTQLATLALMIPAHGMTKVEAYRRELDLAAGCEREIYNVDGVSHRREVFVSHADRVLVLRHVTGAGGRISGSVCLRGTHGEHTQDGTGRGEIHVDGTLPSGRRHALAIRIIAADGTVESTHGVLRFANGSALTILLAAATDYAPEAPQDFVGRDRDPSSVAHARLQSAMAHGFDALRQRHVADHRALFDTMQVDLGSSLPAQRKHDTAARLALRAHAGVPDPELEALYLQYGRYLTIAGSRDGLPTNLQGLWLAGNDPPWQGDYHTDINLEMNYWLPDRAGLGSSFDALANYCLAQLPAWTANTRRWFNDARNPFRNTSGKLAGWTVAISCNPFGGFGWRWHPPGNAWLCNNLWHHYEYTCDRKYLARVFPLFEGACAFWQARLIETTVADPMTGKPRNVLIDDHDWSPEQGPINARGITYAQELVWDLFGHYIEACSVLGRDAAQAKVIAGLRDRLYLPRVSPTRGMLEEWMSPRDLGSPTHRHLSPLVGLFPGDRITPDGSPEILLQGATRLLQARGMHSFGWANAWRAACWARLRDGEKAYQLLGNNLVPSRGKTNGTAPNLFDVYRLGDHGVFQIDANYGTPAAMLDMLLYSRPGHIELLPALPRAWAHGCVTGIGARGGFVVDLAWTDGKPSEISVRSMGGTRTQIAYGGKSVQLELTPGASRTWRWTKPHMFG